MKRNHGENKALLSPIIKDGKLTDVLWPEIALKRTKTLMQGDDYGNHLYELSRTTFDLAVGRHLDLSN